ncbi:hypothetical protein BH11BAC4_BH11BAC4_01030 [soil metagenome]
MNFLTDKTFIRFVIKFLLIFAICYYGTLAIIGVSVPGGYYSPFIEHNLNFVNWIRSTLLNSSKFLLSLFKVDTYLASNYNLRVVGGRGIRLVYECVGYGIMSFWIAFVIASAGSFKKKTVWLIFGLLFIWLLNVIRLSLLLVATQHGWPMPLGWDHHTWFSIFAYLFIFIFIFLFNRQSNKPTEAGSEKNKA